MENKENYVSDSDPEETAEIQDLVDKALTNTLPKTSQKKYEEAYVTFKQWMEKKKCASINQNTVLAYFSHLSETLKPPTLWSRYSMLKSTIRIHENIDIYKFSNVTAFLKRQSDGYKGKKSKVLSGAQVETFLKEAPDNKYLASKVALLFGVYGALRREEIANLKVEDVQEHGELFIVKIPKTKTKIHRSFAIEGEFSAIVKKYAALRPSKATTDRFFLNFQRGVCTNQVIGKNNIGKIPCEIAEFLKLPDPKLYTGHSFRRTSATLLADSGADITTLKRHGGWKSTACAEGYIDDSTHYKRQIGQTITSSICQPSAPTASASATMISEALALEESTSATSASSVSNVKRTNLENDGNQSDKNRVYHFHNCNVTLH